MKIIYRFLKFIYNYSGLKKLSSFDYIKYLIIYYILNFNLTFSDYKDKRIHFSSEDKKGLERFRDLYSDEACVIVGNGPSLNETNLNKLSGIKTFGVNSIFLMTETNHFKPYFYVVEDRLVMKHNLEQINKYEVENKFFPHFYKNQISGEGVNYFNLDSRFYREEYNVLHSTNIKFSNNFAKVAYAGQSVTYINLQLAFFMGFKTVYLIGVDFNYVVPKDIIKEGNVWISTGDDPNHFDKSYFGKGKESNDPQLHKTIIAYKKAKSFYEKNNRKIINCTKGGKLEIFDRQNFDDIF